jgi:hypothetical protein
VRDVRPLSGRGGVAGVGGGGAGREHAENGCGGAEDPKYSRHAGSFLAPPKSADGFGLEVARPTPGRRLHPVRSRWTLSRVGPPVLPDCLESAGRQDSARRRTLSGCSVMRTLPENDPAITRWFQRSA